MLEQGADQNKIGVQGTNSLILAIKGKYFECANVILNHPNTNVNQSNREGHTPISYACRYGRVSHTNDFNKIYWNKLVYFVLDLVIKSC